MPPYTVSALIIEDGAPASEPREAVCFLITLCLMLGSPVSQVHPTCQTASPLKISRSFPTFSVLLFTLFEPNWPH